MNNFLSGIFLISSTLFAAKPYVKQPEVPYFEQAVPLRECQFSPAYSAPARPTFERGWNFFLMGSYLYWRADQEGMELAIPAGATLNLQSQPPTFSLSSNETSYIQPKTHFRQGFKGALGFSCDKVDYWIGVLEYTSMHQTLKTPTISKEEVVITPNSASVKVLSLTNWYVGSRDFFSLPAWKVKSKWKIDLDMGDAYLGRPYYQGRFVTFTPFAGVRGVWLRQNFRVSSKLVSIPNIFTLGKPAISHNYSHSWAVGPRIGMLGRWLLGKGFRLEGDAAGALLFTRYTKVSHRETPLTLHLPNITATTGPTHITFCNYNTVRSMVNAGLGFGWGGYLGWSRDPSIFVDLSANYDFLFFWNQNMMGKLVNDYYTGISTQASNLYMQGITATLRIDF